MNGKATLIVLVTGLLLLINSIYPSEPSKLAAQSLDTTWRASMSQVDCNGPSDSNNKRWYEPAFNDQSWSSITLPIVDDILSPGDRYYRHSFTPTQSGKYYISLDSDDGIEVYINGNSIGSWGGTCHEEGCIGVVPYFCSKIEPFPNLDVTQHIRIGQPNTIAVHVTNHALHGNHWSYFDFRVFSEKEWPDLSRLQKNYNSKRGTNEAGYAHQLLCIASKSCDNFKQQGDNGWASDFIKYLFEYLIEDDGLTDSIRQPCPSWLSNDMCFRTVGWTNHSAELFSGFMAYCWTHRPNINYAKWDSDHESFLSNGVIGCFDELVQQGEMSADYAHELQHDIPEDARSLRETVQAICSTFSNNNRGISKKQDDFPQLPIPPSQTILFDDNLNNGNALQVGANGLFYLTVGNSVQITVTKLNTDGTIIDLTDSPANEYYLNASPGLARVTSAGILSILGASSPVTSVVPVLYVVVKNESDIGIGQFAITDVDSDKDLIVDSYEKRVGLDPNVQNPLTSDRDSDNIPDLVETVLGTNPNSFDSDKDTFSDNYEINHNSDPLDPLCTPDVGCISKVYLPTVMKR